MTRSKLTSALIIAWAALAVGSADARTDTYVFDPAHTQVEFAVKHLVVSTVKGSFDQIEGTIILNPDDISGSSVDVIIKTASVNTRHEKRDGHLKSADFLDVENHPEITFKSSAVRRKGDEYEATGTLTIRGISKQVTLPFTMNGPIKDPWGNEVLVAWIEIEINRNDFDVKWSKELDNGGLVVGDKVKIEINVEATKKTEE